KIQLPNPASIYGAMLAGVDYVLVGAGIPREVPGMIDSFIDHKEVSIALDVNGSGPGDGFREHFDPKLIANGALTKERLKRPKFLAIVSSATLAITLSKKSTGKVDGFIIETSEAGGHNATPRGPLKLTEKGEPLYGAKDIVDLAKIKKIGLPFWLAGVYGSKEGLKKAKAEGAVGIQAGTAFAFCEESGLDDNLRKKLVGKSIDGTSEVFTDPKASPTGFPFKVARLEQTNSEDDVFLARQRVCDLGYLRHLYKKEDATIGYRCPSEPVESFVKKGGKREDTEGRKCLCNGLMANIGFGQVRKNGYVEKPLITAGYDLNNVKVFVKEGQSSYYAKDVIDSIIEE
ncbi:MAG: nitronate monooxygenase, partial [Deltaproteobacteria bacterium]|nr:nitronate monooxygenase [Deltaproteobacteria bacterium]